MRIKIVLLAILSVVPIFSYGQTLSNEDWAKAIQLRMDLSNPSRNNAVCLLYKPVRVLPYKKDNLNYPLLVEANKYQLFDEVISIVTNRAKINEVVYQYDVSELGRRYYTTWQDVDYFGFCFGKLTVDSIVSVDELAITYQYKIEDVPEWAHGLMAPYFDHPLDKLQQATATFGYNEDKELISLSSNYSYYIDAK